MLFLKLKKYASDFLLPLLLFFSQVYFYHTFIGDSGLSKNSILKNQLNELHVDLALVKEGKATVRKTYISIGKKYRRRYVTREGKKDTVLRTSR